MTQGSATKTLFVSTFGFAAAVGLLASPALAKYPDKPIELVCSTKAGSGAARWCQMMADELSKPNRLGVPVNVVYKPGGANHEGVVYTSSKPADGYTILHISGSHAGYFNLPHFTKGFKDFHMVARVERHLYAIAVRCDDKGIKSWKDLVAVAKKSPGQLAMGSNKPGSIHHRQHIRINNDQGIKLRFVPYKGTGGVVKDVVGKHLRVGFAQPGKWNPHIKSGTVCPIALLNEKRLNHPLWKDVPTIHEVGAKYTIPHQWQGFIVKKGTSEDVIKRISDASKDVANSKSYQKYLKKQPHVIPLFSDDRKNLTKDFEQNLKDARAFMIANGIIKK